MIRNVTRWIAVVCLLAAGHARAAGLVMTDVQDEGYPTVRGLQHMAGLVQQRSGNSLSFELAAGGKLGSEIKTLQMTQAGQVAITRVSAAGLSTVVPDFGLLTMPFMFRNALHQEVVLRGAIGQEILAECEKYGLVGLAYYENGPRSFYTAKKQVRSLEDLKGLKIRVQQSALSDAFIRSLGAAPVDMPNREVLAALKSGAIDGAENSWSSMVAAGHHQTARYVSLTEHVIAPNVIVMSKLVWDKLSPEQRRIVSEAAKESGIFVGNANQEFEKTARQAALGAGMKVSELSLPADRQPFVMAVEPVYKQFLDNPRLQDLRRRIRSTTKN